MKKVIFIMIDSLMPRVLQECINQQTVPALQFLKERGMYWDECTTVFPTMTASVDCSLVTGVYPDKHKIPALVWFHPEERRIINYTNEALPVYKLGLDMCTKDVLCLLNDKHLSQEVKTIYEDLADRGRTSGSINLIAHRSYKKYKVQMPFLLKLITKFTCMDDVSGPDVFTMGAMARSTMQPPLPWGWDETVFRHYGINDTFAIRTLIHLIKHNILPDFTMVYLPENDHKIHLNPKNSCQALAKVDKKLQRLLNQFPSWQEALDQYVFIITGDHGQTLIGDSDEHNIQLEPLLNGLHVNIYGEGVSDADDVVLANNERMTYLYPLKSGVQEEVVHRIAQDKRIDIIAWKEAEWVQVRSGEHPGTCRFCKGGNEMDIYGNQWTIEGERTLLDLHHKHGVQEVLFGDYPDVLSRLYGALFSQDVPMVACTSKPGYEFKSAYSPTHLKGGSHGSLHRVDSTIPLIITGGDEGSRPFQYPRLVDLKSYILKLLE